MAGSRQSGAGWPLIGAILAIAAALALALWIGSRRLGGEPAGSAGPRSSGTAAREGERPDAIGGEAVDRTGDGTGEPSRREVGAGEWWVVGRLTGLDPSRAAAAEISVRPIGLRAEAVVGRAEPTGSFRIDVSALFLAGRPHQLHVRADHPDRLVGEITAGIEHLAGLEPAPTHEIPVELELAPPAAQLRGRILTPADADPTRARVGLFEFDDSGTRPEEEPVDWAACAPDGSFRLRAAREGDHLVIATLPGLHPAHERFELRLGDRFELRAMALEPGLELAGRVRHASGASLAGARVRVQPVLSAGVRRELARGEASFRWRLTRAEPDWQEAPIAEDGSFRVGGLSAGPCRVRVVLAPGPGRARAAPSLELWDRPLSVRERVPSTGVEIAVEETLLVLRVTGRGRPLPGAILAATEYEELARELVSGGAEDPDFLGLFDLGPGRPANAGALRFPRVRTDERGEVHVFVHPGPEYRLVLAAPGYVPGLLTVDAGRIEWGSTHEVELEPEGSVAPEAAGDRSTLALELSGAGLDAIEELQIAVEADPWPRRFQRTPGEGAILLGGLEPGPARVHVRPGDSYHRHWSGSYVLDASLEVELAAGEVTRAPVELRLGGRARFLVRGWEGGVERAIASVVDADGHGVPVHLVQYRLEEDELAPTHGTGIPEPSRRADPVLSLRGSCETLPNLPPGDYSLDLEPESEYWPVSIPFTIEPGRTTEVEVVLRQR